MSEAVQYVQSLIKPAGRGGIMAGDKESPFGSDKTNLTVTQMLACVDDHNYDGDVDVVVVVDVDVDVDGYAVGGDVDNGSPFASE